MCIYCVSYLSALVAFFISLSIIILGWAERSGIGGASSGLEGDLSNECSGYAIKVDPELTLDIPMLDQSTSRYCATLGYKNFFL